jgi:hypothetical protein
MTLAEFAKLVQASGLLTEERESALRAESGVDSAVGYANYLVAKRELTDWQADKLITGKWKGFFVDHYKILSHLDYGDNYSRYVAQDTQTGAVNILKFHPPTIRYDVEPPDDSGPSAAPS